jgi:hypothetical protein
LDTLVILTFLPLFKLKYGKFDKNVLSIYGRTKGCVKSTNDLLDSISNIILPSLVEL